MFDFIILRLLCAAVLFIIIIIIIIFFTLGIKDPEGFGKKINLRNCQSDHYSGQSSRINES